MVQEVKEKVSSLEKTLEDFIRHTNLGFAKVQNALIEQKQSMDDFKEEMRLARERSDKEMQKFKEEMRLARERSEKDMLEFKEEMRLARERSEKDMLEFKEEMRLAREQSDKEMYFAQERSDKEIQNFKVEMNKRWSELANRLGTLAEDFVAPNIPFIAQKYFQCPEEAELFMVRCKKRHSKEKAKRREFDIIALYEDKVILNETKSTPRQQYIDTFAEFLPQFFEYFPEYSSRELIPIFASLYVDKQTVEYATRKGIYVLAIKGDSMDLLNYSQLKDSA